MVTYNDCSDILKWRYVDDEETGLYYLRSRYYNPTIGRFANMDSRITKQGNLLAHNVFSYCRNSPICFSDADGLEENRVNAEIIDFIDRVKARSGVSINPDIWGDGTWTKADGTMHVITNPSDEVVRYLLS